ncbi:hypothetical protein KDM41_05500 [bacterium]|nr:hypothetical protein [bacterium]
MSTQMKLQDRPRRGAVALVAGMTALLLVAGAGGAAAQTVTGTVAHGQQITISGGNYGSANIGNFIWDDLEDGNADLNATVGTWQSKGDLQAMSNHNRSGNSSFHAGVNFTNEMWACFKGGNDAPKWYVQYWFYLDNDFNFSGNIDNSLGNIKIFRMWSTGNGSNNLRLQFLADWESDLVVEIVDQGHDWNPVIPGTSWIDQVMGHSAPDWVDPGGLGWRNYSDDVTKGSWHLFQFEYQESSLNNFDGHMRWWFDGKLILNRTDVRTRTSAEPSSMRPNTVGWYNSHSANADGNDHFYLDDVYISPTWARVELGNASSYSACTRREIQLPVSWGTSSVTVNVNAGAFNAGDNAWVYVVRDDGTVVNGGQVTIGASGGGGGGDDPPPGPPGQPGIVGDGS